MASQKPLISIATTSLKCVHFKCFSEDPQGFEKIKPINVIIGRNNTGKTTLLDLVEHVANPSEAITRRGHRGKTPRVVMSFPVTDVVVSKLQDGQVEVRHEKTSTQYRVDAKQYARSSKLGDFTAHFSMAPNQELTYLSLPDFKPHNESQEAIVDWVGKQFARHAKNPFNGYGCRRIVADRDIIPESTSDSLEIHSNGRGLTNVIQRYINSSDRDRDLVERVLLSELNGIFRPDAEYTRLLVQQHGNSPTDPWELYLEEEKKGRIPMSQTGSGLKTVLLVLANLLLVPQITRGRSSDLSEYLFCFEELENNLHPAIQRRLFLYLAHRAIEGNFRLFVTTHSNVVIDLFAKDEHAQILHVTHDGEFAKARTVQTMADGHGILDDLDIRASDLLQTNVVVWVEGPSDAIYFNEWIKLWANGELVDGIHYQCLPVGGSCNAHFSFSLDEAEEVVNRLIPALKINRHAILLADSDKSKDDDEYKVHTKRLADEVSKSGYAWLTKGKEVENYIPATVFPTLLKDASLRGPASFTSVLEYVAEKKGNKKQQKVELAHEVTPLLSLDAIKGHLDMADHLQKVCELIRKWNRLVQH